MIRIATSALLLTTFVFGQAKLPPFPKDSTSWAIRGNVKADTELKPEEHQTTRDNVTVLPVSISRTRLELSGVLVTVRGLEKKWQFAPRGDPVRIKVAVNRHFDPQVVAAVVGQPVEIKNSGKASFVAQVAGPSFQIGFRFYTGLQVDTAHRGRIRLSYDPTRMGTLRAEVAPGGVVTVRQGKLAPCSIHVVAHPVFAITDENGRYSLPKLPNGEYEIVASHRRLGTMTKKVKLEGKPKRPLVFVFHVPKNLRAKPAEKSDKKR